jgi:hypothetical protein
VDERKLAAKPSTTGVVIELTDKEMRVMNKKIKEEVLQKMSQFKAVLGVPHAFGTEHWKEILSKMENVGNYTNQLFFGQSRVSQDWRSQTLLWLKKAEGPLEILRLLALLLKLLKESLTHTLFIYLMMLQLMMLQLVN